MAFRGIASWLSNIASAVVGFGGYTATDPRRKIIDQQIRLNKESANQLLNANLPALRAHCRNLQRNNPTAKAAIEALRGIVVGTGIGLEPDTGDETADDRLREIFNEWLESCGVNGESIGELQGLGMREEVVAGEGLWRLVSDPDKMPIPLSVLPLDAEWIDDSAAGSSKLTTVAGIDIDNLGRPRNYLLRNPETDGEPDIVPASDIVHHFERIRPVQHRGEPWLTSVIETLMNERDLVDTELKAANATAAIGLAITSERHDDLDTSDEDDPVQDLGLGSAVRLFPGESVASFENTRPSQQIKPFRDMLRGDIAAPLRIPLRFLDRDVEKANFSSMRTDMLDTNLLLDPVRIRIGKQTIGRLYHMVLPFMSASLGIAVPRNDYKLLPDGQPYVDPAKDIAAAIEAIEAGLSTYEIEVAKRGRDFRKVWEQRKLEQKLAADEGLVLITPGSKAAASTTPETNNDNQGADDDDQE